MSLVFSNTTTKNGLIQVCERNCGFNDADISGNTTRLAQFTGDLNIATDHVFSTIFEVGGTWQFDDSNHTDYPIITTNLVSGQRDYSFTVDGSSNLILEIYKVVVADSAGVFHEIFPADQQTKLSDPAYYDGLNTGGQPITYDKTANGIFLNPIPNYSYSGGLKVYINREGSYFVVSDTTKKPGFAGLFHPYLALHASYFYCMRNQIKVKNDLKMEMLEMEEGIKNHYKAREKDAPKVMRPRLTNSH